MKSTKPHISGAYRKVRQTPPKSFYSGNLNRISTSVIACHYVPWTFVASDYGGRNPIQIARVERLWGCLAYFPISSRYVGFCGLHFTESFIQHQRVIRGQDGVDWSTSTVRQELLNVPRRTRARAI